MQWMKKRLIGGISLNTYFSNSSIYYQMSIEYLNNYENKYKEYMEYTNNNSSWDILSHSIEENNKCLYLYHQYRSNAIAAIVFQALAIEAYINLYGTYKIGETKFIKYYEKENTIDKICDVCKEVSGKEFPKDKNLYALLKTLIKERNDLVHYKSKSIDFKQSSDQQYVDYVNSQVTFVFKNIKKMVGILPFIEKITF